MASIASIERLSHVELVRLRDEIERLLSDRRTTEQEALRLRFAAEAAKHGFTLDEVVGVSRKGSIPIKYRDPDNPANTWTGRGKTPRWLVAAMGRGGATLEDFRL